MQRLKRVLRSLGAGHVRTQPLFRWLHRVALFGRNFGEGDLRYSGERAVLLRSGRRLSSAKVIFDVGANFGDWSLAAAETWPAATIHAFEPAEAVFERLSEATAGRNVRCVQAALSDEAGVATLHAVAGHPGLSSLYNRDLDAHDLVMTAAEQVSLLTLDSYCASNDIDRIDFLKIDVEGHDLSVLRGAQQMLTAGKINEIQFEFGGANVDSRTYLRDFVDLLRPRYRLSRIVCGGLEPLVYTEREEVFVTSNYLAELA
jgi:FkbM family methyltransferase